MVNDGVITHYDIEQRIKLLDALGASGDLRELAVQQLTEDRVKVQAAERAARSSCPRARSRPGIEEFATGRGLTARGRRSACSTPAASTSRRWTTSSSPGLLWREVVGTRFRARATPTEADLDAALEIDADPAGRDADARRDRAALRRARRGRDRRARRAHLPPARAAAPSFARARRASTAAAPPPSSGGVLDADAGGPAARPPSAAEVLLLSPGQVTRPLPISGGVAIIKLVSIRQVPPEPSDADRRPGGARGAAPAALHRAHHQLRPGLPPGAARRRPHRRAMTLPVALTLGDPAGDRRRDRAQGLGRAARAACRSS